MSLAVQLDHLTLRRPWAGNGGSNLLSGLELDRQPEILRARRLASAPERKDEFAKRKGQPSGESHAHAPDRTAPILAGPRANVAETDQGRGLLGAIDGLSPKWIEGEDDVLWRKNLLRQFGYKL
jgi:hypothetical protein